MTYRLTRTQSATFVTLTATAALTALSLVSPADAAASRPGPTKPTEETAPRDAGDPLMAIVSIKTQHVTIYDAEGWIFRAPVSTGTKGRETPAGVFSVVEKDKDHHSNLYDDAWMPNMERITWSGIALHRGPLPGYAASHGCVRMPFGFAEKLFDKVRIGTPSRRVTRSRSSFPIRRCSSRNLRPSRPRRRAPKRSSARRTRPPG